jgi:hypothetical protein
MAGTAGDPKKAREARLRRIASRRGLRVTKSRRRDTGASDYGMYMIVDPSSNTVIAGAGDAGRANFTLDEVEKFLTTPSDDRSRLPAV